MPKMWLHLIFPEEQIKKPVIYRMAVRYNVVPNIRRANVTEKVGEMVLELSGKKENLEKAIKYLKRLKIKVEPVTGDIVE
ncbi:FeS-binding protein [Caldimicrobium thiodismutans]|jgi:ABC-type methionine transport system ATPase subunit|uniref:FeS-binding protein n=1 Tax=Caldimicrobium thiodismutans TaxID=1653476 RepID=A0A0U5AL35_9BACT|nr:NIL domain-containing protein [Caldimicrobium thiodismutans]BAU22610.1 FeS-binding protein [Caldimicrobium thiodismutans]